ncbi:hypothetical protein J9978_04660 [Chromobacterium violaceum]|uniref:YiiX/YebB-like N1pC/P60 family cysteine hydrolase n=1 Tax=Chromobacterium violaceum TaxID=536 RepID=UPI001B327D34|nr:YiiX/YebB-like N1pC/P60 family cysteine hydrolase [Chromobacterium violaceum]MBP4048787.1 hypothetical protein [Chromobacterium violaceum]
MELQTGDVFLMCGDAKHSDYLALAQKVIYKNSKSSHVLFSFGDGVFVHSTTDAGVNFAFYENILKDCKDGWRVIRMKGLADVQREAMMKASIYFIDQAYNYKFFFKSNERSSFCSELVAKIFERAGINLFEKESGTITPADFDKAADSDAHWEDVTEGYKKAFEEIAKDPFIHQLGYSTLVAAVRKRQFMMRSTDRIFDRFKTLVGNGDISKDFFEKAVAMESAFREKKNISFWNEEQYPNPNQPEQESN